MKRLYIHVRVDEYPQCPLRSDVNSCRASAIQRICQCPELAEDGSHYSAPAECPLRSGSVLVAAWPRKKKGG